MLFRKESHDAVAGYKCNWQNWPVLVLCVRFSRIDENSASPGLMKLDENSPEERKSVKLLVPENSLVLWNSYLLHANECGTVNNEYGWNRRSAFICMKSFHW